MCVWACEGQTSRQAGRIHLFTPAVLLINTGPRPGRGHERGCCLTAPDGNAVHQASYCSGQCWSTHDAGNGSCRCLVQSEGAPTPSQPPGPASASSQDFLQAVCQACITVLPCQELGRHMTRLQGDSCCPCGIWIHPRDAGPYTSSMYVVPVCYLWLNCTVNHVDEAALAQPGRSPRSFQPPGPAYLARRAALSRFSSTSPQDTRASALRLMSLVTRQLCATCAPVKYSHSQSHARATPASGWLGGCNSALWACALPQR